MRGFEVDRLHAEFSEVSDVDYFLRKLDGFEGHGLSWGERYPEPAIEEILQGF